MSVLSFQLVPCARNRRSTLKCASTVICCLWIEVKVGLLPLSWPRSFKASRKSFRTLSFLIQNDRQNLNNVFSVFFCLGETLLSPICMLGPVGIVFNKPVELRLPHRVDVDPDEWSFSLKSTKTAKDSRFR